MLLADTFYEAMDLGPAPDTALVPILPVTAEEEHEDGELNDFGDDFEIVEADLSGEAITPLDVAGARLARLTTVATKAEIESSLRTFGFRIRSTGERKQAITHFQKAWNLGPPLKKDGLVGPKTTEAIRLSMARHRKGLPDVSKHFSFREYRCNCKGQFSSCARIWTPRSAIREDEQYRAALGHGFTIVSACRCPGWNKHVGGASRSRHLVGDARDFPAERKPSWFATHGLYRGRGFNRSNGLVRHGDLGQVRSWVYS